MLLLIQLQAPTQLELMCKQKVRTNAPPYTGVRKKKPTCSSNPKGVSAIQRVKEFSGEMITVSAGKLFCSACWEELYLMHTIVVGHVQSTKHAQPKKQLSEKWSKECDIAQAFKSYKEAANWVSHRKFFNISISRVCNTSRNALLIIYWAYFEHNRGNRWV